MKTIKLMKPNPLFERWLNEWKDEAVDPNTRLHFDMALDSLRKYPLVLSSGKECLILEHFDTALCCRLDRKLAQHKRTDGGSSVSNLPNPENRPVDRPSSIDHIHSQVMRTDQDSLPPKETKQSVETSDLKQKNRSYLPKYRSGAFAILVTLLKNSEVHRSKSWMSKAELQRAAQPLCESSFTRSEEGRFYTAWSSMSQLLKRDLVRKQGNPPRFSLTMDGCELGANLVLKHSDELADFQIQIPDPTSEILAPGKKGLAKNPSLKKNNRTDHMSEENASSQSSRVPEETGPDYFPADSFDIILLVDNAETKGVEKRGEDETVRELSRLLVSFEVRKLSVGDFLWVARHRESGKELVLPYIVERKRMDDLAKSIKDGRYHEQKVRLKHSGLQCLIYLVEQMSGRDLYGLPIKTLNFSITRTQVNDNFFVQIKRSHKESMLFLAQCSTLLRQIFKSKTLFCCKREDMPGRLDIQDEVMFLCTFNSFNYDTGKIRNFSVKEVLEKQLVRLRGASGDVARAISKLYPTPVCLQRALCASGSRLLDQVQRSGGHGRNIGPVLSSTLHSFYTSPSFRL